MKITNCLILIGIYLFFYLFHNFEELGGMHYPLLKILIELIALLFVLILLKYKKNLKEITNVEYYQKKIEYYYNQLDK